MIPRVGWAQLTLKVSFSSIIILKLIQGLGCGCHFRVSSAKSHGWICHQTQLLSLESNTLEPSGHVDPSRAGRGWDLPLPVLRHSESSFGCRGHQGHHTWAVEIGTMARASCVLHIWGLSGDKGVAKEQWHIKKASVRHVQSLEHSRKHPAACLSHDKHSLGLELAQEHLQKGHPSLLTCVFSLNKHPLSLITSSSLEPIL